MSTRTLVAAEPVPVAAPSGSAGGMRRAARRRRHASNTALVLLYAVLLVWTFTPIYNMVMIALEHEGDVYGSSIVPVQPSLDSFWVVFTQGYWYLEHFWDQFGNSAFIAGMVTFLVLLIASLTSFTVGRMRIRNGWLLTNAALLTYVIPASFLAIPFYLIMNHYGLANNPWSVIAALVTFATPYAIFIFQEYGRSIPIELDESSAHLSAADGAGIGRGRHLCAAAGLERISVPVPIAVGQAEHDRASCTSAVPEQ